MDDLPAGVNNVTASNYHLFRESADAGILIESAITFLLEYGEDKFVKVDEGTLEAVVMEGL